MKSPIIKLGTTYIYKDDVRAIIACIVIFILGFIMVEVGKDMDREVERQHQAELEQMRNDIYVNNEVTRH